MAIEQAICRDPTVPPSMAVDDDPALSRRLAGDLDAIILHAMEKQPERRYLSAGAVAEDLRRHLEHWPVRARRPSPGYRLGKFILRNKVQLASAGVAAAVAGTAGFAIHHALERRQSKP